MSMFSFSSKVIIGISLLLCNVGSVWATELTLDSEEEITKLVLKSFGVEGPILPVLGEVVVPPLRIKTTEMDSLCMTLMKKGEHTGNFASLSPIGIDHPESMKAEKNDFYVIVEQGNEFLLFSPGHAPQENKGNVSTKNSNGIAEIVATMDVPKSHEWLDQKNEAISLSLVRVSLANEDISPYLLNYYSSVRCGDRK